MPVLIPILERYWKPILAGGLILVVGLYIGLLKYELANCRATEAMFKAVQARNEEAIKAQNGAIRKMWKEGKTLRERGEKASTEASLVVAKAVAESRQPVRFRKGSTCDSDVMAVFNRVKEIR